MNTEEKDAIWKLCHAYRDIFHTGRLPLTFNNQIKHQIRTKDENPTFTKSYRYPEVHKEEVRKQIYSMLGQGIIQPSISLWSSPIWIVDKKMDASKEKKWRLVVDYRKLNEKTIDDKYPLPNINDILDKLGKSMYFTTLDLASGFHQVEMHPDDIEKTAFSTENGHYEFLRMPFGLKNAPATFQRVMDNILRGIQNEKCLVYLDDIIIFSTSLEEHISRLKEVFERLRKANFKIQLDKSEFLRKEVAYLGHVITPEGVKPNPDKIKAVMNYPLPKTQKEIKGFLGLLGYYRKFIPKFAQLTKPLTKCLKKNAKITHDQQFITTFETCKKILINHPILQYPDFSRPFILTTDASNVALGAVLSQGQLGEDKPIAYASRTLNETEQKYSTIEKELFAIVWATKYFRPYLYGRKFTIYTDHRPLQWLFSLKEPNSKLVRWRLKLEEYDYDIVNKKGKFNTNADALSRIQIYPLDIDAQSTAVQPDEELERLLNELIQENENQNIGVPNPEPTISNNDALPIPNLTDFSPTTPEEFSIPTFRMPTPNNTPRHSPTSSSPRNLSPSNSSDTISAILGTNPSDTSNSRQTGNNQPNYNQSEISQSESTITNTINTPSVTSRRENNETPRTINICEDAIDRKERQIFITTVFANPSSRPKIIKENGMTIIKAHIPQDNNNQQIKDVLIDYCEPKRHYYCFFDTERMYRDFCKVYNETFNAEAPILKITDKNEQKELIRDHHEGKTNHRGIRETYTRLQRLYYWPKLTRDVADYINKCEICKRTKYERHPPEIPLKLTEQVDRPFQQTNMDLFTIEGTTFLTVIDAFTKLAQAYQVSSKNAIEICDKLLIFFQHYGVPEKITFDSGLEFQNDTVKKLLETHKIKSHFTTPRHPQSNGLIERLHSTLTEHYRILKQYFKDPPITTMAYAIIGYNNSIHSVTNYTPLELLLGHTTSRNPFDIYHDTR